MKLFTATLALVCTFQSGYGSEIRLLDLEPTDAQQYIDKQDTTLKYAPKVDSNVPAVRFLGNEPHNVLEDIYLANQYHGQDGLGGYLYGYAVPDIAKTERKKAGGDLRGAYNYIAGNGQEIKVEYWDDGTGFHQVDNVQRVLPQQIEDTPEVKAAREDHFRLWQEIAERNSKPVQSPYNSEGQYAEGPLSVQGQQQRQQQFQQQQYQQPLQYNQHKPSAQPQQYSQSQPQQYSQPQPQQYSQPQPQQYSQPQSQQYSQPSPQPQQFHQPQPAVQQSRQNQQSQLSVQQPQQYSNLVDQYQQQKQQFPNPGQSVQYQGDQAGQYQGQQTQTVNQYQKASASSGQHSSSQQSYNQAQSQQADNGEYSESQDQSGQYNEDDQSGQYKAAEGEENGPPKGFFYSFDYPVGIIVQKEGAIQKREGDLKDIYATNKGVFEKQLQGQGQRPTRSSTGYLYVGK